MNFLKTIWSDLKEKYISKKNFRLEILFIIIFIFLVSFLSLSKSNPFSFYFPYYLYPITFKTFKKNIEYFSYDRNTEEFIKIKTDLFLSGNVYEDVLKLAQITQQPKTYLRENLRDSKDVIFFPPFSLSITEVFADSHKLYIFIDDNFLQENENKKLFFNNETPKLDELWKMYEKSLIFTLFENFPEFSEIHWIQNQKENIWEKNQKKMK